MRFEGFRDAWRRARPVIAWGALVDVQVVALVPVWGLLTVDAAELEQWLTVWVPSFIAFAAQPFLGAVAGARLFTSAGERATAWLDNVVFGFVALLLLPLPAEALRWALMATLLEGASRAQSESWMFLLFSVPVTAICFASGTIFGQVARRFWRAALAGHGTSLVLLFAMLVMLEDGGFGTHVAAASALTAVLFFASALVRFVKGGPIVRAMWLPGAVACVAAAGGIGLWQYARYDREHAELRSARRELEATVENAKTTAARLDEFRVEYERKEEALAALRVMLPESLDVPAFLAAFEAIAAEHSVRVVRHAFTVDRYEFYDQAVINVELEGDAGAIDELESSASRWALIVHWRNVTEGSERKVALSIFAARPPPAGSDRSRCPAPDGSDSEVWLWPMATRLEAERERVENLCGELAKLEPIVEVVDEYQRLLVELEEVTRLVERLDAER